MPYRRTYWLIISLLFAWQMHAQTDSLTSANVESRSYELYLSKNWKELNAFCDKAIREGYDYYYLRMRAGIAAYEKGNYRKAVTHFQKALSFNSPDETAEWYLYYSHLYAGEFEEARNQGRKMDTVTKKSMQIDHLNPVSFATLEGATKLSDSSAKFKPVTYGQFGLQHYIKNRFSLYHALTYYAQDEYRVGIKQYQYYLDATIPLKHRFVVSPAVHVLYDDLSIKEITTTTVTTIAPPQPGQPPPQPGQQPPLITTVETHTNSVAKKTTGMVAAAMLTKRFTYADVSLGATACFFDTATQYQLQAGLTLYPFGNRQLAFGAYVYDHTETYYKTNELAIAPFIASRISKKWFLSAAWLNNRGANIAEGNGYLVNNSFDVSVSRLNCMAEYQLLKKMSVYAVYSYETKQEKFTHFTYHYNLCLLGIKFTP